MDTHTLGVLIGGPVLLGGHVTHYWIGVSVTRCILILNKQINNK